MSNDDIAIEIQGLTKVFGEHRALDGIDLSVPTGSIFGFLGPNGAGKSTAINILTGLARPTSGSARIFGHDVVKSPLAVHASIGYLPDVPGFYPWMTASEFLRFSGELSGIEDPVLTERVNALLDFAGLEGVTSRVGGFSRGMKQRLGLAQALISSPPLLLLDEPTSALDPIGRKTVLDMISALAGRTTVFFSSHILADVERVCDLITILDKGRIVLESSIADLKGSSGTHWLRVELDSTMSAKQFSEILTPLPWVHSNEQDGSSIRISVSDIGTAYRGIPALIAKHDLALVRLDSGDASLEEVFVKLVGGSHA